MQYKVLESGKAPGLEKMVNRHMSEGWEPQGGICKIIGKYANFYTQAMILRDR
jgi:hypothetical protein